MCLDLIRYEHKIFDTNYRGIYAEFSLYPFSNQHLCQHLKHLFSVPHLDTLYHTLKSTRIPNPYTVLREPKVDAPVATINIPNSKNGINIFLYKI